MFRSIGQDIRNSFDYGNMVTRLLIINVVVFVITALLQAFMPFIYGEYILPYIALPGDVMTLLFRPWTLITHMFVHAGFWHLISNLIVLYWFGGIVGDLLGDRKILPLYILGGLAGAFVYVLSFSFFTGMGSFAVGASAAALALTFAAVAIAPDYVVYLILLGPVRIKFIGLFILFMDIIGTQSSSNSGGHLAHLGGTLFGFFFIHMLRNGRDISEGFNRFIDFIQFKRKPKSRAPHLKVAHKSERLVRQNTKTENKSLSIRVDEILDKIKQKGYDSLTDEEKEVLYQASKSE